MFDGVTHNHTNLMVKFREFENSRTYCSTEYRMVTNP